MSERSEHLIERAAALLRSANAAQVVDRKFGDLDPSDRGGEDVKSRNTVHSPPTRVVTSSPLSEHGLRSGIGPKPSPKSLGEARAGSNRTPVTVGALERAGLMVARMSRTRTTEEYRIVIGRVLRALHDGQESDAPIGLDASPNVVMVTSARPGEGKSFTSLNLGGSIAQNAGESVLIVDVDAKNNSLSDTLGLSDQKGFLDLVADPGLSPADLIIPSELPNLSFLALGSRSVVRDAGNEAGFEERRLTPPIQRLARLYPNTLILLDAPPCLSTSDPHTLSPAVGQVVVVVEAERTQRSEVEAAVEMIKVCPVITMLLNKVRMTSSHTFGTYDYFGSYT